MSRKFAVKGAIAGQAVKLRWKPVKGATAYQVEWLENGRTWGSQWNLYDEESVPGPDGFIEYIDEYPGPTGAGGTYRVAAYTNSDFQKHLMTSPPVVVRSTLPAASTGSELRRRLAQRRTPAAVKAIVTALKRKPQGWTALLPADTGTFHGLRVELNVQDSDLTDAILDMLQSTLPVLPKLMARAEKAFNDYGGTGNLDEDDKLARPRLVLDSRVPAWTLVVEVKNSDYAWHIEFVGKRFKKIWAGT